MCGGMLHVSVFNTDDIAAFNGGNNPDHFFWGEIANQLGKGEQFRAFWTAGPNRWIRHAACPGGETAFALLPRRT